MAVSLSPLFSCHSPLLTRINGVMAEKTGFYGKQPIDIGINRSIMESAAGCRHRPVFPDTLSVLFDSVPFSLCDDFFLLSIFSQDMALLSLIV
jgi:hypothetical protein